MPPAVESSDEGSDGGTIPHTKPQYVEPLEESGDEEEEDEEDVDADEEGVFVVEGVVRHKFEGKRLLLEVKWKGYKDEDNTWEPEQNVVDGAEEILEKYFRSIGGRPEPVSKGKKKRNLSENGTPESSQSKKKTKRSSMLKSELDTPRMSPAIDFEQPDWVPHKKDWEKELMAIDTIEREGKSGTLYVYLHWKNGRKSKVNIDQCYDKCPKAMLRFYEEHLVFKTT